MIIHEDECCDCAVPGYPCLGDTCQLKNVPHYYCDKCGEEVRSLNDVNGIELCDKCYVQEVFPQDEAEDD